MGCPVCQSCGMPIYLSEMFGTDKKGASIEDYCIYCYKDGQFTSDVTMEEMIKLCTKYLKGNARTQATYQMKIYFPTLKRWAQKENTQNEYHKSINKVLDYIHEHLNESPSLDTLSEIAHISPFHFHRIFKAIIGENLGEYIQRLRLEYIAGQLTTTGLTLDILAEKTGYKSTQALSKAFKKHFGVPPSIYKVTSNKHNNYNKIDLQPRICKISNKNVIYIRIIDEYGTINSYEEAWKRLYTFAILNNALSETSESLGISFDDPSFTSPEKCRFYACVSTEKKLKASGKFGTTSIKGGLYAIFTHKGPYQDLHNIYKNIWFNWLPLSKYYLRKGSFFEKYLNNPSLVKEEDILTEIYIPVSLKKQKQT